MNDNVRALPVHPKRGRHRVHPVPGVPVAPVLALIKSPCDVEPTADERLARIDAAVTNLARAMLTAIRVTREISELARS